MPHLKGPQHPCTYIQGLQLLLHLALELPHHQEEGWIHQALCFCFRESFPVQQLLLQGGRRARQSQAVEAAGITELLQGPRRAASGSLIPFGSAPGWVGAEQCWFLFSEVSGEEEAHSLRVGSRLTGLRTFQNT